MPRWWVGSSHCEINFFYYFWLMLLCMAIYIYVCGVWCACVVCSQVSSILAGIEWNIKILNSDNSSNSDSNNSNDALQLHSVSLLGSNAGLKNAIFGINMTIPSLNISGTLPQVSVEISTQFGEIVRVTVPSFTIASGAAQRDLSVALVASLHEQQNHTGHLVSTVNRYFCVLQLCLF